MERTIENLDFSMFESMSHNEILDFIIRYDNKHELIRVLYELDITKCFICGKPGYWKRQSTAYAKERDNWACACTKCQNSLDDHWRIMWLEVCY